MNIEAIVTEATEAIEKICRDNGVAPAIFHTIVLDGDTKKVLSFGSGTGNEGIVIKLLADTVGELGQRLAVEANDRASLLRPVNN